MADDFAKGLFSRAMESVFPPVYPLFVALFHLVIPDVETAGRMVSLLRRPFDLHFFLFARRFFRDEGKALWVALLVAFHPYLVRYSGAVLSEACAAFLFTATVFSFYMGWQEGKAPLHRHSGSLPHPDVPDPARIPGLLRTFYRLSPGKEEVPRQPPLLPALPLPRLSLHGLPVVADGRTDYKQEGPALALRAPSASSWAISPLWPTNFS